MTATTQRGEASSAHLPRSGKTLILGRTVKSYAGKLQFLEQLPKQTLQRDIVKTL